MKLAWSAGALAGNDDHRLHRRCKTNHRMPARAPALHIAQGFQA